MVPVLPKAVRIALTVIAVALVVLNQVAFGLGPQWHAYLLVASVFLAGLGIHPGPVASSIALPAWVATLVTAGLSAAALAVTFIPIANVWHAILAGVLTFIAALGFHASSAGSFAAGNTVAQGPTNSMTA